MQLYLPVVILLLVLAVRAQDRYTTKWDSIDLDQILASDRLLKNYINCILDKGRCTPDGSDLKKYLPDALATDCKKCSDAQKKGADIVIRFLIKNKKDWFKEIEEKYDPDRLFKQKYPELFTKKIEE